MHAVHQLYQYRKNLSTTAYKSRGHRVNRCPLCHIAQSHCICAMSPSNIPLKTRAGFLLLMYDTEVLKPSNTGKLIADVIPDTFAFLWSRTENNLALQAVLDDPQWFPMVVFPQEYAQQSRKVYTNEVSYPEGKRPLFIMLDGSWREAKKMFRKSTYLDGYPMVSFNAKGLQNSENGNTDNPLTPVGKYARYTVRKTLLEHQFSTAEVAARVLDMQGENDNAQLLDLWFDVFNFQYQKSVCQRNKGNIHAIENYQQFVKQTYKKCLNPQLTLR